MAKWNKIGVLNARGKQVVVSMWSGWDMGIDCEFCTCGRSAGGMIGSRLWGSGMMPRCPAEKDI
jgi:hypothetical protein